MIVQLVVCSHAVLAQIRLNGRWEVDRLDVLATGHHYGTALPGPDGKIFITMVREDNVVAVYQARDAGPHREVRRFVCEGDYDDIHQVASWGEGLLIANTGRNSVDYVAFDPFVRRRYFFNGFQHDVNHVNSVFPCGGTQVLALLNNRGTKPSELAVLSWDPQSGFEQVGALTLWDQEAHNVFVDGERLVYNASHAGDFVIVSLDARDVIRRLHFPGYTKGLCVTREHFIVGYSDKAVREDRTISRGYLAIIDRGTLELEACVDLNPTAHPPGIGNVNEVRCLSEMDHGHSSPVPVAIPSDRRAP